MIDWLKIEKVAIFKEKDENGNRYLSQFLADYKRIFNPDVINAGCDRCLEDYYKNFIKHLTMSTTKEENQYVLKKMYNGIPLNFGSPILVTNQNMKKEYAEQLLKNHPRGADLFDKLPDGFAENTSANPDPLKALNRDELDKIATDLGLVPADYSNKDLIKEAIKTKQEEIKNTSANPE